VSGEPGHNPRATEHGLFAEHVCVYIARFLKARSKPVVPESSLSRDFQLDSIDFLELVMALEKQFGVQLPDAETARAETVADIIDILWKHQRPRRAG
jgi:acyl carrier protein